MLDILHRNRLALRIHNGVFSTMDFTPRHPRTAELLSMVKFMVQTLAVASATCNRWPRSRKPVLAHILGSGSLPVATERES
ncbi:hypothetical protein V1L54_11245 [Streptomyces sp. TRM 70361]|uniref:hypothetical protein n=1 Tax=Streptomyces sp. TRM 70361 TaxID=3116553 RepID=UPI002E7AD4A4|nr:hypothetical protein [Streptomyces sp. TRM 70361]MEE1939972.1 hypothetical protein [Streptomyces sp. TRM 70361]